MAGKQKCPPAGAPEWVLTYGDMMSLLLTFFIMLAAMSEIKKEDEFRAIIKEVQKAFGMHGGGGHVPSDDDPALTFMERIEAMQLVSRQKPLKSQVDDPGVEGPETLTRTIRPMTYQTTGTRIIFEPGSTDLNDDARTQLVQLAARIRGFTTKVVVSGHTDTGEMYDGAAAVDLRDLSYRRARVVMDYLAGDACRIEPERLQVVANGDSEKLVHGVYTPDRLSHNRRVEIFETDLLIDEASQPEKSAH